MVELLFVQALILVFLLTYMWAEETFLRRDYWNSIEGWQQEIEWRNWMNELDEEFNSEHQALDEVARGMDLAGWHPLYGADGIEGV